MTPDSTSELTATRRPAVTTHLALVVLFGCITCLVYLEAPQPFNANGGDNLWYVPTAMSLAHRSTLNVSRFRADCPRRNRTRCGSTSSMRIRDSPRSATGG